MKLLVLLTFCFGFVVCIPRDTVKTLSPNPEYYPEYYPCVDDHWRCHFLALVDGKCSKDPYTSVHCKKSCNACDVVTNPGQGRFKVS